MSEKGFIKLDRKLLYWGWKKDYMMVALWIEILLQANIEGRVWKGEKYERGTFPTSVKKLSENTGISTQSIRTCLNRLKSTNEITIETTNKGMKISVVNWEEYQGYKPKYNKQNNKHSNKQLTNNQQTTNKQLTTLKEIKKERIEEDIYKWREAGFENEVDEAMKILGDDITNKNFSKVMNILTDENISNKKGYIYTLQMKGEL